VGSSSGTETERDRAGLPKEKINKPRRKIKVSKAALGGSGSLTGGSIFLSPGPGALAYDNRRFILYISYSEHSKDQQTRWVISHLLKINERT